MKTPYLFLLLITFFAEAQNTHWQNNYDYVDSFSDNVAIAKKNFKYGVVNYDGKELIPLKYDEIKRVDKVFFKVKKDNRYGLYSLKGEELIEPIYEDIGTFKEDIIKVKRNSRYGILNKNKYIVVPFQYDYIDELSDGLILFKKGWKYGFLDKRGKEIIPPIYDKATPFKNRKATVTINNWEFIIEKHSWQ